MTMDHVHKVVVDDHRHVHVLLFSTEVEFNVFSKINIILYSSQ